MAKEDAETRAARSLKKEYEFLKKQATRPGVPQLEADYFSRMAQSTASKIDWRLLEIKKKAEVVEQDEYSDYRFRDDSRGKRYH
jgi:hypothetical protein